MNVDKDDLELRLDVQLGDEFRSQLDRQLGRAAPYFLKHAAARVDRQSTRRWRHRAAIGLATFAAACCAGLIVWQQTRPADAPVQPGKKAVLVASPDAAPLDPRIAPLPNDTADIEQQAPLGSAAREAAQVADNRAHTSSPEPLVIARTLTARTLNEGTLLVGRTPMRKVRRQWLERVEWFDPANGARVQRIMPREEVLFVPLPIN